MNMKLSTLAGKRGLASIFAREEQTDQALGPKIKKLFRRTMYSRCCFMGKLFMVKPDLVERFA